MSLHIPQKSYTPVADYFIGLSNATGALISNLKLQKLVYYAEAWHLAYYDESLIKEDFHAWVHGPVIPELFDEYRKFSWLPIEREDLDEDTFNEMEKNLDERLKSLFDDLIENYFDMNAWELERMTQYEEPWRKTRIGLHITEPTDRIIDKKLIKEYYRSCLKDDSEVEK